MCRLAFSLIRAHSHSRRATTRIKLNHLSISALRQSEQVALLEGLLFPRCGLSCQVPSNKLCFSLLAPAIPYRSDATSLCVLLVLCKSKPFTIFWLAHPAFLCRHALLFYSGSTGLPTIRSLRVQGLLIATFLGFLGFGFCFLPASSMKWSTAFAMIRSYKL